MKKVDKEEVIKILEKEGFRIDDGDILTKDLEYVAGINKLTNYINSDDNTLLTTGYLALANIVKNKLEEKEND